MRRYIFYLFILLSAAMACMSTQPELNVPKLPTAFVVTQGPNIPPAATIQVIDPSPEALPISPTDVTVETEYRLRIQITTSSDWTNLEILNSEIVRDAKITAETGSFTNHTAAPDFIAMNQLLDNAFAGKTIMLQVDLLINANAGADKLDMILQKGDIGLATLRFYRPSDGGDVLIQEISHDVPEGGPTGLNELSFSISLK